MSAQPELLPCPFCGREAHEPIEQGNGTWRIFCCGYFRQAPARHLVVKAWNTRAPNQPLSDSGPAFVVGSIYEGMAAAIVRDDRTIAHFWQYADAREVADLLNAAIPPAGGVETQESLGVPASPSGQSAKPEPSCTVSARGATVPNAAWLPMSCVPTHGRRIYALQRGGKAHVAFANPELQRSLFLAWWPLPEDRLTAPPESAGQ